jgi:hypothetical protein
MQPDSCCLTFIKLHGLISQKIGTLLFNFWHTSWQTHQPSLYTKRPWNYRLYAWRVQLTEETFYCCVISTVNMWLGYLLDDRESIHSWSRNFYFITATRLNMAPKHPPHQWVPRIFPPLFSHFDTCAMKRLKIRWVSSLCACPSGCT